MELLHMYNFFGGWAWLKIWK